MITESRYFLLILKRKLRKVKCSDYKEHILVSYKTINSCDIYVCATLNHKEKALRNKSLEYVKINVIQPGMQIKHINSPLKLYMK